MDELNDLREYFDRQGMDAAEGISAACSYLGLVIAEHSATDAERQLKARRVASWIDEIAASASAQIRDRIQ